MRSREEILLSPRIGDVAVEYWGGAGVGVGDYNIGVLSLENPEDLYRVGWDPLAVTLSVEGGFPVLRMRVSVYTGEGYSGWKSTAVWAVEKGITWLGN